jgi:hypothetical protein
MIRESQGVRPLIWAHEPTLLSSRLVMPLVSREDRSTGTDSPLRGAASGIPGGASTRTGQASLSTAGVALVRLVPVRSAPVRTTAPVDRSPAVPRGLAFLTAGSLIVGFDATVVRGGPAIPALARAAAWTIVEVGRPFDGTGDASREDQVILIAGGRNASGVWARSRKSRSRMRPRSLPNTSVESSTSEAIQNFPELSHLRESSWCQGRRLRSGDEEGREERRVPGQRRRQVDQD